MYALLQNKFSNYWTCSLHIDIEENIIIEAFGSLCFDPFAITAPHYSISRGAFDVSECVYYGVLCCSWMCLELHHRGRRCTWTCLHQGAWVAPGLGRTGGASAAPGHVYPYTTGAELHLDVFRLLVACAAAWLVYTAVACAASGHVYTLGPELHLDVSYPQGPVPTYLRTCSLRFASAAGVAIQ